MVRIRSCVMHQSESRDQITITTRFCAAKSTKLSPGSLCHLLSLVFNSHRVMKDLLNSAVLSLELDRIYTMEFKISPLKSSQLLGHDLSTEIQKTNLLLEST